MIDDTELRYKIAKLISEGRSGNMHDARTAQRIMSIHVIRDGLKLLAEKRCVQDA